MDYCLVINLLLVRKSLFYREVRCLYGYFEKYYVYCFNNIYKIFILYKLICKWLCCKILIFLIYYCFLGLKMGFFVVILNFKDNVLGLLVFVYCGYFLSEKC